MGKNGNNNSRKMRFKCCRKLPSCHRQRCCWPGRKDAVEEAARRAKASTCLVPCTAPAPAEIASLLECCLHPETESAQNISPAIVCQEQVLDEGVAVLAAKRKLYMNKNRMCVRASVCVCFAI